MPSFTNLCQKIECLTDRRFTISHLAQLKFVLPEVIEITKALVKDGRTIDMKLDLHVTMNVDAVENDDKLKFEGGGHMHLRRAFRHRLGEISKSHPEGYEIPESNLNIICSVEEASIAASSFEALVEQQLAITPHLLPVFLSILFFFE